MVFVVKMLEKALIYAWSVPLNEFRQVSWNHRRPETGRGYFRCGYESKQQQSLKEVRIYQQILPVE
jgi:hypothetical protein